MQFLIFSVIERESDKKFSVKWNQVKRVEIDSILTDGSFRS